MNHLELYDAINTSKNSHNIEIAKKNKYLPGNKIPAIKYIITCINTQINITFITSSFIKKNI